MSADRGRQAIHSLKVKNTALVATIPESDVEIGGEAGQETLTRIERTFGRMEAIWNPVGSEEGNQVVRQRLFVPLDDEPARDRRELPHAQIRVARLLRKGNQEMTTGKHFEIFNASKGKKGNKMKIEILKEQKHSRLRTYKRGCIALACVVRCYRI